MMIKLSYPCLTEPWGKIWYDVLTPPIEIDFSPILFSRFSSQLQSKRHFTLGLDGLKNSHIEDYGSI
ncbi:hypothetical protein K1T71_006190 [Dendrolimus kikuchii]|uniref:Uncharacterized protein n=1 Tax=Dendrolimus kikuchii TaxID=765133 RepID=A0ACC1D3E9_9NEOP|nr:hypothetical protein K1T71_006190 [Dendrolimus kikuchii]